MTIPFNLDLAKAGKHKIVTARDVPVEIITFNARGPWPIMAYVGDGEAPVHFIEPKTELRLVVPWTMPDPPAGKRWHREDWTYEMLDGGWRPLLAWEVRQDGDEVLDEGGWHKATDARFAFGEVGLGDNRFHSRTRRPLPGEPEKWAAEKAAHAAGKRIQYRVKSPQGPWCDSPGPLWGAGLEYRIAPDPVPWDRPDDVPAPVCWVKAGAWGHYLCTAITVHGVSIRGDNARRFIGWAELAASWRHSTDRKTWLPCVKPEANP